MPLEFPDSTHKLLDFNGFEAPSYRGRSLSTALPAIVAALSHEDQLASSHGLDFPNTARAAMSQWGLQLGTSFVLLVIDGLGFHNIAEFAEEVPYLAKLNNLHGPARSGFPSTTAASMSIIGTGAPAGLTGIVGYSAYDTSAGELANFVSWRGLPEPTSVQRQPVLFESLATAGVSTTSIGLARYNGSGLTTAALRGPHYIEAPNLRTTFNHAAQSAIHNPLTHVYWAEIDKIGHYNGVGSTEWRKALREFDTELQRFVENLPPNVQILVTADHGMINVEPKQRIDVARNYALSKGMRALAGEPRCSHVYFNSQSSADSAKERWTNEIGDRGVVLTKHEVIDSGLYGPVADHVAPWIGHLMVIARDKATVVDSGSMSPMALNLKGVHGSLTATEVMIPGIVITS